MKIRALLIVLVGLIPGAAMADPIAILSLRSEPGDFIGQGQTFDFTYQAPFDTVSAQIRRSLPDGRPAELVFVLDSPTPDNQFALLFFGTDQLGIPIQAGVYTDAQRADFAAPGHPGLDVSFQNRGSNTLTGSFVIFDVSFLQDPFGAFQIAGFHASFEQHSEGMAPALFGEFQYDASGAIVPEPGTMVLAASGLLALARRYRRATHSQESRTQPRWN
jgi:hypothetical protein